MEDLENYKYICSRLTLQSKSLGFFNDLLEKVVPFVNLQQFALCRTDFERITYCARACWHLVGAELIFKGKDPEVSLAKRLEGNAAFEKHEYPQALLLYCQSIIRAPVGPELALTYANRSALLKNMEEWQLAVDDVKSALQYGYPENKWDFLYERLAICHFSLKNYAQAKISINLCKELTNKYNSTNEKLKKRIEKLMKRIEDCEKTNVEAKNFVPPIPTKSIRTFEPGSMFPAFSTKVDINYTPEEGRFAYAREEIFSCERLLEERPYASCLLPERMGSFCLHCFKRLKAPVACDLCANVAFCSKACKQLAEVYHQHECRVLTLLIGSGMSIVCHLALRMITQSPPSFFLEKFSSLSSNPEQIRPNGSDEYASSDYQTIYNLSGLETERTPQDFLERTIMAVFLMKCLRIVGYFEINLFKNPEPTMQELQIGSLILRHLQIVQFNAYEIHEFIRPSTENFRKVSSINLGIGLYPTAAFLNHSCAPNVTRYFSGTTLLVTSLDRIGPGTQISDNYGPIFTKMAKTERLKKLLGRYWFKCSCSACVADWPPLEQMSLEISPTTKQEKLILKQLEMLEEPYYEKALQIMDGGLGLPAVELLRIYLDKSSPLIAALSDKNKPYKTFHLAQEALKLILPSII